MGFIKYLVPALSAATAVYAASCSTDDTFTVQNQGDASSISGCDPFDGDIKISPGVGVTLDFGTLKGITGTLSYSGDSVIQSVSANSVGTLGGLEFTNLSAISTISFTGLTQVGDFMIQDANVLSAISLPKLTKFNNMKISNTQISSLDGFATATEVESVDLSDNNFLKNISFAFSNMSDPATIAIGPNSPQGQSLVFPNLNSATTITFRNSTDISTPALSTVAGTLGLYGNTIESYSAPNLTSVGGLVVTDNIDLTNLTFPELVSVNSTGNSTLQVANNTKLASIDGFPKLASVKGDVDLSGAFDNFTFPSISVINGALNVDTSSSKFDCNTLPPSPSVVRGHPSCHSGDPNPTSPSSSGGDGSGSSGGSGTSSGGGASTTSNAAVPLDLPVWMTGAGLLGGVVAFML